MPSHPAQTSVSKDSQGRVQQAAPADADDTQVEVSIEIIITKQFRSIDRPIESKIAMTNDAQK